MATVDLPAASELVAKMVTELGEELVARWGNSIIASPKDATGLDVVTELDLFIERSLVKQLSAAFPETGFRLEEQTDLQKEAEYEWVIDPIDGTKYFASGVPLFCISVGLTRNEDPVLGVIYNPVSGQLYVGGVGVVATLNGTPISVRDENRLSHTMLSVDFSKGDDWEEMRPWMGEALQVLAHATYRTRMLGTGALSLAWVASGSIINAYVSLSGVNKYMDVAAGIAICRAAGAEVVILKHPVNRLPLVIAGKKEICSALLDLIQQNLEG